MTPPLRRPAWWRPSPTSVRLLVGFMVPIAVFAVASILSMRYMERIVAATDTVRALQRGLEAALQMQNLIRQQDAAHAELALSEDPAAIERFDAARSQMLRCKLELVGVLDSDEERRLLWKSGRLEDQVNAGFHRRFVPAVMDNDSEKVSKLRHDNVGPVNEIITITEILARSIQAKADRAVSDAADLRSEALRNSGLLLAAAVILAVVVALLTSRSVVNPVQQLIEGTEAVAQGRLDHAINILRPDEFGRLADSFNRMTADLREHQKRLVQAEKMATLGQLAAGIAHEINNPIGVILGYTGVLARDETLAPGVRDDIATIRQEARQCKRIVQDLLDLSRPPAPADDLVDAAECVREAAGRVAQLEGGARLNVECEAPEHPLHVRGDADKLRQVLDNLVRNAVEAMPAGGRLRLLAELRPSDGSEPDRVVIEVQDTGCGMTPEQCERAFDPFFSTKRTGLGLGLSIVYNIVRAHQGHIAVSSVEHQGSTFTITLPAATQAGR